MRQGECPNGMWSWDSALIGPAMFADKPFIPGKGISGRRMLALDLHHQAEATQRPYATTILPVAPRGDWPGVGILVNQP